MKSIVVYALLVLVIAEEFEVGVISTNNYKDFELRLKNEYGNGNILFQLNSTHAVARMSRNSKGHRHVHKFKFRYNLAGYNGRIIVSSVGNPHEIFKTIKEGLPNAGFSFKSGIDVKDNGKFLLRVSNFDFLNETLHRLAVHPQIIWYDFHRTHKHMDYFADRVITLTQEQRKMNTNQVIEPNYSGKDSVITVGDTGIDLNHCMFDQKISPLREYYDGTNQEAIINLLKTNMMNKEVNEKLEKVIAYISLRYSDGVDSYTTDFFDNPNGHGTHVAGLAAGDDSKCKIEYHGHKSKSKLIMFDFENSGKSEIEGLVIPPLIRPLLDISYFGVNSRLLSFSWGSETPEYTVYAMELDQMIYEHDDYVVFIAAGNSGPKPNTIGSPATFKNGITVGASQNDAESFLKYQNNNYWQDFKNKFVSADVHKKHYGFENLADFSSRGSPTGRIKPDIVCPGQFMLSSRSQGSKEVDWLLMQGTSQATPKACHYGSVIIEKLVKAYQMNNPSAALVKNIMITTAETLTGSAQQLGLNIQGTIVSQQNPDYRGRKLSVFDQGFGRLNTAKVLNGKLIIYDRVPIKNFEKPYKLCLRALGGSETSIGLVWTDPPALVHATNPLINNLNLKIVINNNRVVYGNHGGNEDILNNVERIRLTLKLNDTIELYVYANEKLTVLRPIRFQTFSLVLTSTLEVVECNTECGLWSPPYLCPLHRDGFEELGEHKCVDSKFDLGCMERCYDVNNRMIGLRDYIPNLANNTCECYRNVPCKSNGTIPQFGFCDMGIVSNCTDQSDRSEVENMYPDAAPKGVRRLVEMLQATSSNGVSINFFFVGLACSIFVLFILFILPKNDFSI